MILKKVIALASCCAIAFSLMACGGGGTPETSTPPSDTGTETTGTETTGTEEAGDVKFDYTGKKILFVDSYKDDYPWSRLLGEFFVDVVKDTGVEYKILRMDTKNNTGEDFKVKAGEMAFAEYEAFKPDVVIAADDNATKYFVSKYLKDAATPVVIIGVNWSGDVYGLPYKNTTGLYEVQPAKQAINQVEKFSDGKRIGFISSDNATAHKDQENMEAKFNIKFEQSYFCKTAEEFKTNYKKLQTEVDMVMLNNGGSTITGWDAEEIKAFVLAETKVPSTATFEWMTPFTLLGVTTVPKEHAEYAAQTALQLISAPDTVAMEFKDNAEGNIFLNQKMADKLGVTFEPNMLKVATMVE